MSPTRAQPSNLRLSTALLLTVAAADLVATLILLRMGMREGNPLFAPLLARGETYFAAAKVLFVVLPVLILELARRYRPALAELGTWIAFFAYFGLFAAHIRTISG